MPIRFSPVYFLPQTHNIRVPIFEGKLEPLMHQLRYSSTKCRFTWFRVFKPQVWRTVVVIASMTLETPYKYMFATATSPGFTANQRHWSRARTGRKCSTKELTHVRWYGRRCFYSCIEKPAWPSKIFPLVCSICMHVVCILWMNYLYVMHVCIHHCVTCILYACITCRHMIYV